MLDNALVYEVCVNGKFSHDLANPRPKRLVESKA